MSINVRLKDKKLICVLCDPPKPQSPYNYQQHLAAVHGVQSRKRSDMYQEAVRIALATPTVPATLSPRTRFII